ncbi:uncharacterized protein LOC127006385 isoform X3 [Eriocheir sinensis]|nr:uncharacterized protein LOC127006385 isoform X3 [Eriocheir sinensis]XP_050732289.1 uncharacterized protein LOC127006385 isoform X3 [Eriocheir sinensis]
MNIRHPVRSVRYVGNSRAKTMPALHLYALTWYRGTEHVIEVGPDEDDVRVPNFHNFGTDAKSLIGVGSDWTLFNGPNFNGPNCTCLQLTHFSMSSYDGDNAMLAATFHPYLTPDDAPVAYTSPVGQISPVGSAILTCRNVPMRKLCAKLPWENVHRSQCPILSRGVKVCESEVVGWF